MYLLIISLSQVDYKEDVLLALQSVGIQKASVIDAQNLSDSLNSEFSLFSGFFSGEKSKEKLIIISRIKHQEDAKEFISNLEAGGVPLRKENILDMYVLPTVVSFESSTGLKSN